MFRERIIICIGSAWDYDPTSKHQIMKILARENRILWINYHGSRCPSINRVDHRCLSRANVDYTLCGFR